LSINANTNDITTSVNDITGDKLISKHATQRYRDNYDMIFHNHKNDGQISVGLTGECYCTIGCECKQKDSEGKI
jgi:hypothetical protein